MEADPVPRDSERRQATVIFADISGFTAMSEKMDPEDVTSIMNQCFAMMEEAVHRYGGVVDKYIGDCIMALFGLPNAIENAPKQAVNAAIEIRQRVAQFREADHIAVPLDVHIGINSGLVLAGYVGGSVKREFTVMGDTVNLASRLKDVAPLNSIYVGPGTYRYTRSDFEYRALKPITLKGKEHPVTPYEVRSVTGQLHRTRLAGPERGISSAMIGRDPELGQLRARMEALAQGHGGIITIIGEAGMGKSRLMTEAETLDAANNLLVLKGRSLSIGQRLSFHPFIDLFRHWADIAADDTEEQAVVKLDAAVTELAADTADDLFPFICTLMGMRLTGRHAKRIEDIEGETLEKLIAKSVREVVSAIAAARPLLLVFEDLHWADLSSIQLIQSLLRVVDERPVLFALLLRPEYADTSERLLQHVREHHAACHADIQLKPLDAAHCDLLIRSLLRIDDLPHALWALVSHKAEGNPFFIEEVIHSLIDESVFELKDGRLRVTEKIDDVVIPGSVQEVIMARVDRVPESIRRVLQVASVIGRSFSPRVLTAVMDSEANIEAALAFAQDRQLISMRYAEPTAQRRAAAGEDLDCVFTHALIQETIYESILQKNRKEWHLKTARAIESLYADRLPDFFGMLAYHYSRADHPQKAEEHLFKAGEEAARSAASSEALHFFQEASKLYFLIHGDGGDPTKKALLEKNIGLALLTKGELLDSVEHFNRALQYLGEWTPKKRWGFALRAVSDLGALAYRVYLRPNTHGKVRANDRDILTVNYHMNLAQSTSNAERYLYDCFRGIRRLHQTDPAIFDDGAGACATAAAFFSFTGLPLSTAASRRFREIARNLIRPGNIKDEVAYRTMDFVSHYLEGDWSEQYALDEELVENALRYGRHWHIATYLDLNCERKIFQGEFLDAARLLGKIAEISDAYGYDFAKSSLYGLTGLLCLEQRQLPAAVQALDLYYNARHEPLLKLRGLGNKAKAQLLLRDREGAAKTLAQAHDLVKTIPHVPPFHASAYLISRAVFDLEELEMHRGAHASKRSWRLLRKHAKKSIDDVLRMAHKLARERTEAYRLAGCFFWLTGEHKRALLWWRRSILEGQRLGTKPELARTFMEVGQRLAKDPNASLDGFNADAYLEKARQLFSTMDLASEMARLADRPKHVAS